MDPQDVQTLLTAVIAGATVVYVIATWKLVSTTRESTERLVDEGRAGRREERSERRRSFVRAAIAEAVENCRAWMAVQPRRLSLGEEQRHIPHPEFASLTALVENMDLPSEVVAYLIWARGYARDLRDRYAACVAENAEGAQAVNECRGQWDTSLDLLQSVALLVRAHATTDPDLIPVTGGFASGHWLAAQPTPPRTRELEHVQRTAMDGAPNWPSGDAYAGWSPSARDQESSRNAQRQEEWLHDALDARGRA